MSQEALQRGLIEPKNCTRSRCSASAGACLRCLASRAVARAGRPGQAVQVSSSSCRTTCLSGHAQLRHWEPGPSGAPGWAPGLRRRPNEVSMLSGSPGPAEAAAARAQKRKFDSRRCSDAESRNRKCRCGPHVWSRGPVVFCPLARANIETLPTGGGEHKTRRRRRVTSQSQVSDAGSRVAEHDDG